MSGEPCPRCKKRGKTWKGDDPKCAFMEGFFDPDNWNCATVAVLRSFARDLAEYSQDHYAWLTPISGEGFLVLHWYKSRGRTERCLFMSSDELRHATLAEVEAAILHQETEL